MFYDEFYEIHNKHFFAEHLQLTASEFLAWRDA